MEVSPSTMVLAEELAESKKKPRTRLSAALLLEEEMSSFDAAGKKKKPRFPCCASLRETNGAYAQMDRFAQLKSEYRSKGEKAKVQAMEDGWTLLQKAKKETMFKWPPDKCCCCCLPGTFFTWGKYPTLTPNFHLPRVGPGEKRSMIENLVTSSKVAPLTGSDSFGLETASQMALHESLHRTTITSRQQLSLQETERLQWGTAEPREERHNKAAEGEIVLADNMEAPKKTKKKKKKSEAVPEGETQAIPLGEAPSRLTVTEKKKKKKKSRVEPQPQTGEGAAAAAGEVGVAVALPDGATGPEPDPKKKKKKKKKKKSKGGPDDVPERPDTTASEEIGNFGDNYSTHRLQVSNLPLKVTKEALVAVFPGAAEILITKASKNVNGGLPTATIRYENEENCKQAFLTSKTAYMEGRPLVVAPKLLAPGEKGYKT